MKLWNGRISASQDDAFERLNVSLPFDKQLALFDVRGSIAWANALSNANVLTTEEANLIEKGLRQIEEEFKSTSFIFQTGDEDIHTAVERRLIEIIGQVGGKLHTGRSRNDQVATDFRLWVMDKSQEINKSLIMLQRMLIERAEMDWDIIIPGYTHTQQAQPVMLSHWWLSFFWAFLRDHQRIDNLLQETSIMPLGSGAIAGSGFNIDRFKLAKNLGFSQPSHNSIDAVSDRDFAAGFLFATSMIGIHLSRMAEALILFSTREFSFITLPDEYATGSSLMPQKRNPDSLELTRAKSSLLIGRLTGLLSTLKALPSAYDKDLQEDKPAVFEAASVTLLLLQVMSGLIRSIKINPDSISRALDQQMLATDLADYLVKRGVPFRQAHAAVANLVSQAETMNIDLPSLDIDQWQKMHPSFDSDVFSLFDIRISIEHRNIYGGTAPTAVKKQLEEAKKLIQ